MTKLNRGFAVLLVFPTLLALGCLKDPLQSNAPSPEPVSNFRDIDTPAYFNWETSRTVLVIFTAIPDDLRRQVLKISTPDGQLLYRQLQPAAEGAVIPVEAPGYMETITVSYGEFSQSYHVTGNNITVTIN